MGGWAGEGGEGERKVRGDSWERERGGTEMGAGKGEKKR